MREGSTTPLRLDVQALRALAVVAVIGYHFWPSVLPGGFAGVDAFFVVSGFLVGGALVREAQRSGRIDWAHFFLRRTRRLLPAALVVVVATSMVAFVVYSPVDLLLYGTAWSRPSVSKDAIASTMGVSNIWFDLENRPYDAADSSPFTHFWSLAVEVQFYLLMPLLALLIALVARKGQRALALLTVALSVALLDVMFIVDLLVTMPLFFNPVPRLWEFFAGVVVYIGLAHAGAKLESSRRMHVLAAAGWISLTAFFFVDVGVQSWPGAPTLWPVLASAAIILGNANAAPWARLTHSRVVQWTGDASYSLYLVHWPVLVLSTAVIGRELSVLEKVAALVLVLVASAALYRWVETPWRRAAIGTRPHQGRFVVRAGVALIVTLTVPVTSGVVSHARAEQTGGLSERYVARPVSEQPQRTWTYLPANLRPALVEAGDDRPFTYAACNADLINHHEPKPPCVLGPTGDDMPVVVLIGDSHAAQWVDALWPGVEAQRYRLVVLTANGCSLATTVSGAASLDQCDTWRRWALAEIGRHSPDLVVTSTRLSPSSGGTPVEIEAIPRGVDEGLTMLGRNARVVWIADTPMFEMDPVRCAAQNPMSVHVCSVPRAEAINAEIANSVQTVVERHGGTWLDLNDYMCDDTCPIILEDVLLYRDDDHLTSVFARELAGVLEEELGLSK